MKKIVFVALSILFLAVQVSAIEGAINVRSDFNVKETADRMERILNEKGMTIFKRINHSRSAANVGVDLQDTELIIFGNPKIGSHLMKCKQSVAIDLPQKALIWEDDNGKTWISYNDPRYLAKRHNISGCEEIISKIENALGKITKLSSME